MRPALIAAIAALAAACGPSAPRPWAVDGGFIRDTEGRAVVLRGANVSGRNKNAPWFDFHGPADFRRMRVDWGMNAVRFLTTWAAIEPERDQLDQGYLDALQAKVGEATDAGLLVFVDMHQDLYGVGFSGGDGAPAWTCDAAEYAAYQPQTPWFFGYLTPQVTACVDAFWTSRDLQQHYVNAWSAVAKRLKSDPGFIGIDPMNEPYWGSVQLDLFESRRLAPLYQQVIAAVRVERPDALAFVEPAASRNLGLATHLPPLGIPGVVYAPHSYDADAEQGKPFTADHRQTVLDNLAALKTEAGALGAALTVGEYGGMITLMGIGDYLGTEHDALDAQLAGGTYWDYSKGGSYSLLNDDGTERTVMLDAVALPYPERVAGTPLSFGFDPAARTFHLRYAPDRSLSAPTRIAVPTRTWPQGFTVDCGGCQQHLEEAAVVIDQPAKGAEVDVTLAPR